jgi:hypothetical protein
MKSGLAQVHRIGFGKRRSAPSFFESSYWLANGSNGRQIFDSEVQNPLDISLRVFETVALGNLVPDVFHGRAIGARHSFHRHLPTFLSQSLQVVDLPLENPSHSPFPDSLLGHLGEPSHHESHGIFDSKGDLTSAARGMLPEDQGSNDEQDPYEYRC